MLHGSFSNLHTPCTFMISRWSVRIVGVTSPSPLSMGHCLVLEIVFKHICAEVRALMVVAIMSCTWCHWNG